MLAMKYSQDAFKSKFHITTPDKVNTSISNYTEVKTISLNACNVYLFIYCCICGLGEFYRSFAQSDLDSKTNKWNLQITQLSR
ncbi:MAG: hypothetical protein LBQ98_04205 [Nitrososphaerota archaeon]|nr:hypothetical protein [Nitrososphaerota archaeon]